MGCMLHSDIPPLRHWIKVKFRVKVRFRHSFTEVKVRVRVKVRFRHSFTEVKVRIRVRFRHKP